VWIAGKPAHRAANRLRVSYAVQENRTPAVASAVGAAIVDNHMFYIALKEIISVWQRSAPPQVVQCESLA
jgi:hypothetical protein